MSFNLFFFVVVVYNMLSKEKEKASTLSYITIYIFIYIFIYLFRYIYARICFFERSINNNNLKDEEKHSIAANASRFKTSKMHIR